MGNKNQWKNYELSPVNVGSDTLKPYHDLGVVRFEANGGVESHFPSHSWWRLQSDIPSREEGKIMGWRALSANSLEQALPKSNLLEGIQTKKMLGMPILVISLMGCLETVTLVQMCGEGIQTNLLITSREEPMGIVEHVICLSKNKGMATASLRKLSWKLLNQARNQLQISKDSVSFPPVSMNIICWNCRGTSNPRFKPTLNDLISIHTDTIGYAGGLWLLWKSEGVEVIQLAKTEQEIHVIIKVRSSDLSWVLTCIYASPRLVERKLLWGNLSNVASLHSLPWLMLGDFNEVLSINDKSGGNLVNMNRALRFKDCLDFCGMIDLGFHGARLTWVNKNEVGHFIQERLDRAFANSAWSNLYPEAIVKHLPKIHSNHCPILLSLEKAPGIYLPRPFRFQPNFIEPVKIWNKEVFGNIFQRKSRIVARLNGIQKALANGSSSFLIGLEKQLSEEYWEVNQQEEELWSIKSQYNWLIQEKDRAVLDGEVTRKEVKVSLWSMKPFKAPGPDGYHAGFYQRNWHIIKDLVVKQVVDIFESGKMPNHLNETLITLIPKCPGADCLGLFRPISLCNTIYKLVSKVLVHRLGPMLNNLVSPLQSAFGPGRKGMDNMIIVQELIHSMKQKKGKQGYMAIKVDLEKAYDRMEWHFI
ncbi:uncharacterized protein LOC142618104 [Castanea sativa]|uniref:uncharacterized protein LOC142618104 n=1 Tax=Castanea sativa TaxID=21020 RepID=UPI003F64B45C